MNEADLDRLIDRAGRRLRLTHAIKCALLAIGIFILLAAAVVLWGRLVAAPDQMILAALLAPVFGALVVWLLAYWHERPSRTGVAMLLDKRAATAEHLVTWHELRLIPLSELTELQQSFREAQRAGALQRFEGCRVGRLVPVRLPSWTRSLGLAMLLLCCALLVPPREPKPAGSAGGAWGQGGRQSLTWSSEPLSPLAEDGEDGPRVQVLSPTENIRYWLELTDPGKSLDEKAQILKQLESKLGLSPQTALSPELQQVYSELRRQLEKKKETGPANAEPSSIQAAGATNPDKIIAANAPVGAANRVEFKEKAFAVIKQNYADVEEPLERYYKAVCACP
jgi:hypothetical protein